MATTKKKRRAWGSNRIADDNGMPIVGGEPLPPSEPKNDLGTAIETVRRALEPFDEAMRKRVVRAAAVMLKE